MSDVMKSALDALLAGGDPLAAAYGESAANDSMDDMDTPDPLEASTEESSEVDTSQESESNEGEAEAEDAEGKDDEGEAKPEEEAKKSEAEGDVEYITVTDETGKKRLKIDWSNKELIKKQLSFAAGARKWQAERDAARNELKAIEPIKVAADAWSKAEEAFNQKGLEGLVDLLAGKEGAFTEWKQKEVQRAIDYSNASPEQKSLMEMQAELEKQKAEAKKLRDEAEKASKKATETNIETETSRVISTSESEFNKIRFSGTLGDPEQEAALDDLLWGQAMLKLDKMIEDNVKLDNAAIAKVFESIATPLKKTISAKAEKEVKQIVEKKKESAQVKLNAEAKKASVPNGAVNKFNEDVKRGNLTDALKAFMTGKVKV